MSRRRVATQHTAEVILIPKQLRMDWVDVLALDKRLSDAAFRVACVVGTHFGNKSGMTYVSQETIAAASNLSAATVNRSIAALEETGYLIVRRREVGQRRDGRKVYGGRGTANEYLPAVDSTQISVTDRGQRLTTRAKGFWSETENRKQLTSEVVSERKHLTDDVLSGAGSTSLDSPKHLTGEVPTLNLPSEGNSSEAFAVDAIEPLGGAGRMLRKRLGNEVFAAWFGKLDLVHGLPPVVILQAPSKFIRNYVTQHFLEAALSCWRAQDPKVERIRIVHGPVASGSRS